MQINGKHKSKYFEDPIFEQISMYRVVETKKNKSVMLHLDGSASVILELTPMNHTGFSDYEMWRLNNKQQQIFRSLDTDSISVSFHITRMSAKFDTSTIDLAPYLNPRVNLLNVMGEQKELFQNKYYITVHCKNNRVIKKKSLYEKAKDFYTKNTVDKQSLLNKEFEGINERINLLLESAQQLNDGLRSLEFQVKFLKGKKEYYNTIENFFRPDKSKNKNIEIDENLDSPRQSLFSGTRATINTDDFVLDNYLHKIYTLDKVPRQEIGFKDFDKIMRAPFEFLYTITFRLMKNDETNTKFKFAYALAEAGAGGNKDAIFPDRQKEAYKDTIDEMYNLFAFNKTNAYGVTSSINFALRIDLDYLQRLGRTYSVESKDELMRKIEREINLKYLEDFGQSSWVCEQYTGWEVYCKMIPGMSEIFSDTLKKQVQLSVDLPYFLPLYSAKMIGTVQHFGTNHFIDENNNLILFALNNSALPANNISISGQTGSGKSVLMNTILAMQFAQTHGKLAPLICILDVGGDMGSYRKIREIVNGEELNMSGPNKPCIQILELHPELSLPTKTKKIELTNYLKDKIESIKNLSDSKIADMIDQFFSKLTDLKLEDRNDFNINEIFEGIFKEDIGIHKEILKLKEGECRPSERKMNLIMAVMEVILSKNAKNLDGFDRYNEDQIAQLIIQTYDMIGLSENRYPRLRDLVKFVQEDEDSAELIAKISNWTTEGQYPMFDRDSDIDLSNNFILADLKGLESNPKLQLIYTLLLSDLFSDKMYFGGDRVKLIVRDEAWALMQNGKARDKFGEDLRTARKSGFATISISQLPYDYLSPDPAVGEAIMESMQVNIFCKFDGEDAIRRVADQYKLTEEMAEQLSSLGTIKVEKNGVMVPDYSKFMMKIGKNIYILKNKLSSFEYYLYSSSRDDNAIINFYRKRSEMNKMPKLFDVLMYLSEGKHKGDQELYAYLMQSGLTDAAKSVIS